MKVFSIELARNRKIYFSFDDHPYELSGYTSLSLEQQQEKLKILVAALYQKLKSERCIRESTENALLFQIIIAEQNDDGSCELICAESHEVMRPIMIDTIAAPRDIVNKVFLETRAPFDLPQNTANLLEIKRKELRLRNEQRRIEKKKEIFLTHGPQSRPDKLHFPELPYPDEINKKIDRSADQRHAMTGVFDSGLLSPCYSDVMKKVALLRQQVDVLEKFNNELAAQNSDIDLKKAQDDRFADFIKNKLADHQACLLEKIISVRDFISGTRADIQRAVNELHNDMLSEYKQYVQHKAVLDFTAKTVLYALYNAAVEYYAGVVLPSRGEPARFLEQINTFNSDFKDIAFVDDAGAFAQTFIDPGLQELAKLIERLFASSTHIFSAFFHVDIAITKRMRFLQDHLNLAAQHCRDAYRKFYGENLLSLHCIYQDDQPEPFRFDTKSFTWNLRNMDFPGCRLDAMQSVVTKAWKNLITENDIQKELDALSEFQEKYAEFSSEFESYRSVLEKQDEARSVFKKIEQLRQEIIEGITELNKMLEDEHVPAVYQKEWETLSAVCVVKLPSESMLSLHLAQECLDRVMYAAVDHVHDLAALHRICHDFEGQRDDVIKIKMRLVNLAQTIAVQRDVEIKLQESKKKRDELSQHFSAVTIRVSSLARAEQSDCTSELKKLNEIVQDTKQLPESCPVIAVQADTRIKQLNEANQQFSKMNELYEAGMDSVRNIERYLAAAEAAKNAKPVADAVVNMPRQYSVGQRGSEQINYAELIHHIDRYIQSHHWQVKGLFCMVSRVCLSEGAKPKNLPRHVYQQWLVIEQYRNNPGQADPQAVFDELQGIAHTAMGNPNSRRMPDTAKYYGKYNLAPSELRKKFAHEQAANKPKR